MGASVSTNSIKSMLDAAIDVTNTYAQVCSVKNVSNNAEFIADNCTLDNSVVKIGSAQAVSQSCITNANIKVAIATSISQTMRQAAQAIVQQFAFGTVADANNFIETSVRLGDTVSTAFNSTCSTVGANQSASFVCTGNSKITNSVIQIDSFQNITQSCIINAVQNTDIYNKLVSDLSQSAVAQQQATFGYILLGFVLILAIGAWFVISIAEDPLVQWAIVGLILFAVITSVVYALTAKSRGSYPYRKP